MAQNATVKGKAVDNTFQSLPGVVVQLQGTKFQTTTDEKGAYSFDQVPFGNYIVSFYLSSYHQLEIPLIVDKEKENCTGKLKILSSLLTEFEVTGNERYGDMAFLSSVHNMGLYANMKSEIITLEKVNGNKSTNNPRQIFARVAGLNIWESDGAGLQLGIGGRGLSPNRTSNFNTRQNGYDISADALGYPESYYTPSTEALESIEVVRGAASLQYGTQFGGLLNFVLKKGPTNKPIEVTARNTVGSFGLVNSFTSLGGTVGRLNYYAYYQNKQGDGWRPNSEFEQETAHTNLSFALTEKAKIGVEYTHMTYLAHQAGGLTDIMFEQDPQQSIRERNWFNVNWNLAALTFDYDISDKSKFNLRTFGLMAERKALGFLGSIARTDPLTERDLIWGEFKNWGSEARFLHRYSVKDKTAVMLIGARYYQGYTRSRQGDANDGYGPDFEYLNPTNLEGSDYEFPSDNMAFFAQNVFFLSEHISLTPGARYEYINTASDGIYKVQSTDLAGNIIYDENIADQQARDRQFLLAGLGMSWKSGKGTEVYANYAQNYRAINFNDIRIVNPNFVIDPNIHDESGFTADLGFRGNISNFLTFDATVFYLQYKNRIGEYYTSVEDEFGIDRVVRYRSNIADARNIGFESFAELEVINLLGYDSASTSFSMFGNFALINAEYVSSDEPAFDGKKVELVPEQTFKFGATFGYKAFSITLQHSYTGQHFTDATNAEYTPYAVDGLIPAYQVADLSMGYSFKKLVRLEAGVNNFTDQRYFTRRAAGYPGPGIIPSDARSFYLTLQIKI